MAVELHEQAPAKINLRLVVEGRRADGYHLLSMLNATLVSPCDEIFVRVKPGESGVELELSPIGLQLPVEAQQVEHNLATRAALMFCQRLQWQASIKVRLTKRIPTQAGLGGGSSDAAATLRACRDAYRQIHGASAGPDDELMCEIASAIGADVPFLLEGGLARVTGIGDIIQTLPARLAAGADCVLVLPKAGVSTAAVFAACRLWDHFEYDHESAGLFEDVGKVTRTDLAALVRNDLERWAGAELPLLPELLTALRGVPGTISGQSGSGSTCFVISNNLTTLKKTVQLRIRTIAETFGAVCLPTRLLA